MSTATTIAIIAPNVVAATAIIVGWLQHDKSLGMQRKLADLDNVRSVLDDAAVALHNVTYALDSARSALGQWGRKFFDSDEGTIAYEQLKSFGQDVDVLVPRLAVRLGREHEAVIAFEAAVEDALDIFRALGLVRLEPEPDPGHATALVRDFIDKSRARITERREQFDGHREMFMDAAQRAAGAKLSS